MNRWCNEGRLPSKQDFIKKILKTFLMLNASILTLNSHLLSYTFYTGIVQEKFFKIGFLIKYLNMKKRRNENVKLIDFVHLSSFTFFCRRIQEIEFQIVKVSRR